MGKDKHEFESETRVWLATHLFVEKILSLGKAAELAGIGRLEFLEYLQTQKVDVYRYDDEELAEELENIKKVLKG